MTILHFNFNLTPVPKARPRLGKFRTYTPSKTKQAEWEIKQLCMTQLPHGWKPSPAPATISVAFSFVKPKSAPRARLHHTVKPDIDNLIKSLTDAFNGLVWVDDSQVYEATTRKVYAEKAGIQCMVRFELQDKPKAKARGKPADAIGGLQP